MYVTLWILFLIFSIFTYHFQTQINENSKKLRILSAFHAWVIRSISNYMSWTDLHTEKDLLPLTNKNLPLDYNNLLDAIYYELSKDLSPWEIIKLLENGRELFNDRSSKSGGDGFVFIYYDLYEKINENFDLKWMEKAELNFLRKL